MPHCGVYVCVKITGMQSGESPPPRFCPLVQFALRMQKVLELSLFLVWGSVLLCFPRWPVSLSLFHPRGFLALLGPVSLIIKVTFPPDPVPTGSSEPGSLGRAAQQASQSRYFNCRAPPGFSWDRWGPWMGKEALVSPRTSTAQLALVPWGLCSGHHYPGWEARHVPQPSLSKILPWNFKKNNFQNVFLAMLGLCCCMWAFSSCSEKGLLSSFGTGPSHCGGFSCCGAHAGFN